MTGFKQVIDIIDYFSKYIMSFPVVKNDAINSLNSIKQFCILIGKPNIIQTDNGLEFKNASLDEFCLNKNIKHFYSSPYTPNKRCGGGIS